ncbi:hypothetical protein [Liquorilactobacillus ghanensis]|uniref:hypothetical protein n=1 Tax=Liquorilactobacillus ghanensis TaxID=399370 RepID=UPI00070C6409
MQKQAAVRIRQVQVLQIQQVHLLLIKELKTVQQQATARIRQVQVLRIQQVHLLLIKELKTVQKQAAARIRQVQVLQIQKTALRLIKKLKAIRRLQSSVQVMTQVLPQLLVRAVQQRRPKRHSLLQNQWQKRPRVLHHQHHQLSKQQLIKLVLLKLVPKLVFLPAQAVRQRLFFIPRKRPLLSWQR